MAMHPSMRPRGIPRGKRKNVPRVESASAAAFNEAAGNTPRKTPARPKSSATTRRLQ